MFGGMLLLEPGMVEKELLNGTHCVVAKGGSRLNHCSNLRQLGKTCFRVIFYRLIISASIVHNSWESMGGRLGKKFLYRTGC